MHRLCAWCGADLDEPGQEPEPDARVSHGICHECLARMSAPDGTPLSEFLASLDEPVILMDEEHTVGMVNEAALQLLGRPAGEVIGERSGAVFDCENASMPGGCGNTIHCSGCTIRQAVAATYLSGEPQLHIPATLRVMDRAELVDAELTVSTARVDGRVLLRIERFDRKRSES